MSNDAPPTRHGMNRRDFLKRGGYVAGAAAIPVTVPGTSTAVGTVPGGDAQAYPVVDVTRLADLAPGATVSFNYPDPSSPALLLRLAEAAVEGVGDDASVVAFSVLCTHKGCAVNYKPEHGMLVCPCHWSTFDPARGGSMIIGQGSAALPRVQLKVTDGMVQAVGMDGLIYGRHTNIL